MKNERKRLSVSVTLRGLAGNHALKEHCALAVRKLVNSKNFREFSELAESGADVDIVIKTKAKEVLNEP